MDKHIEILKSLINKKRGKKKKEFSIKEKEDFSKAWIKLSIESNFDHSAEQFLYEGFGFCGVAPFYSYLLQKEDKEETLNALFNGNFYGKDSSVTFRLVTHLLALMLNDNSPQDILSLVIRRFKRACVNKDQNRLGTAEKTMEKYFFSVLSPDAILCPLASIDMKPLLIKEFISLVSSIMANIENSGDLKDNVAKNIKKVREWFVDYDGTFQTTSETDETVAVENKNNAAIKNNPQETTIKDVTQEEKSDDAISNFVEFIGKLNKLAFVIKAENDSQKKRIKSLEVEIEIAKNKLTHANQEIAERALLIRELQEKLSAANETIFSLNQDVKNKETLIVEKDDEIADRIKMADVISRDKNKQAEESLQRLASKIKIEYLDFMDARDIPMNCDLGENLRLQLQNVFEILEKGGMKLK